MEQSRSNILPRIENTFFISLRQDLLLLCQSCTYRKSSKSKSSSYCKAFILAVMENWTNNKIDRRESVLIPMTMPQWIEALYSLYGYNAIADSLEELTEEGLISREKFKANRAGKDQYRYLLNFQRINALLQTLTFPGLLVEQTVTNQVSSLTNQGLSVTNQGLPSSQTFTSNGLIEDKDSNIHSNTEEDASLSSPALSIWNTWCEAQGYKLKRNWTKTEQERCLTLANMCKEANINLTPQLMNEVREWAQAKQSFLRNNWALKNLINALPDYFIQINSVVTQSSEVQDLPELTEEEAEHPVLWSRHPSKIITMIQRGENTIEDHWQELVWMSHSDAREYGYDSPLARRYTREEIERYKQLTSQQATCIAQQTTSYNPTHRSHTATAVESTR